MLLCTYVQAQSSHFLQKAPAGEGNMTNATADMQAQRVGESANSSNITLEAAFYARRSTASLTCSHWGQSAGTCSGTLYGPCPGWAGSYYTCSGDWSHADGHMSSSNSCNACGLAESSRYAKWAFGIVDSNCHGSFSNGGGYHQRTCIGRCSGGGEYSCSISETGETSVHIACSSTCTGRSLP